MKIKKEMEKLKKMNKVFKLSQIRKIVERKKPGLIACNMNSGFDRCIVIFEQDGEHYKAEESIDFFKNGEGNIQISCEEVMLEVKDVEFSRVREKENNFRNGIDKHKIDKLKLLFG